MFNIGPEGMILVYALIVSILVAVLTWRRIGLVAAAVATLVVALALVIVQYYSVDRGDAVRQVVVASFIVVPSVLLLGASRVRLLARHAWVLVLLGPIAFVGCYVGICELCVHLRLI